MLELLTTASECWNNEAGKGDHRHVGEVETKYAFSGYDTLLSDFWADVDDALRKRR